jgi:hypothetical protein
MNQFVNIQDLQYEELGVSTSSFNTDDEIAALKPLLPDKKALLKVDSGPLLPPPIVELPQGLRHAYRKQLKEELAARYRVEWRRWYILMVYCLGAMAQSLVWITFSTLPNIASDYYGADQLTQKTIDLLLNYGPIMYIPSVFFTMWLTTRGVIGLQYTLYLGVVLMTSGSLIRCVPCIVDESLRKSWFSLVFLHIGQILNGEFFYHQRKLFLFYFILLYFFFSQKERTLVINKVVLTFFFFFFFFI